MRQLRQLVEQLSTVHDDVLNTSEQRAADSAAAGQIDGQGNGIPAEGSKAAETDEHLQTSLRALRSSAAAIQHLMAVASSAEAPANVGHTGQEGDAIDRLITSQARHISGVAQQLQALLQSMDGRSAVGKAWYRLPE
jgi:hypothetical protein